MLRRPFFIRHAFLVSFGLMLSACLGGGVRSGLPGLSPAPGPANIDLSPLAPGAVPSPSGTMPAAGGGTGESTGGSTVTGNPSDAPNGSSTVTGNPALTIQMEGAVGLVLRGDSTEDGNLQKIIDDELVGVFEGGDPELPKPEAREVYVGDGGRTVLLMKEGIPVRGGVCALVTATPKVPEPVCIDPDVGAVRSLAWDQRRSEEGIEFSSRSVQFDAGGRVYFADPESGILKRWDSDTGSLVSLADQRLETEDYIVSSDGVTWVLGRYFGETAFGRLLPDGRLYQFPELDPNGLDLLTVIPWETGKAVVLSANKRLLNDQSYRESSERYLWAIPFDGNGAGTPMILEYTPPTHVPVRYGAANPEHYDIHGEGTVLDVQSSRDGTTYALVEYGRHSRDERKLIQVSPEVRVVSTGTRTIRHVRVVGDVLYYSGVSLNGNEALFRDDLLDYPVDLLNGVGIKVRHFEVIGDSVYFDGESGGQSLMARIDMSAGNQLIEIESLDASLLDLESF